MTGAGTPYVLTALEGLPGITGVRDTDRPRPRAHGSQQGRDLTDSRVVTASWSVNGAGTGITTGELVDRLATAWHIDDTDVEPDRPFIFRFPDKVTQRVVGRPRPLAIDTVALKSGVGRVTGQYVAGDPFVYSDDLHATVLNLATAVPGRPYPLVFPRVFGAASGGIVTATNAGKVPTSPTARIFGPCTNPSIELVDTGEVLDLTIALGATDYLDVDFGAPSIVLNGTASRYNAQVSGSTFWRLLPGDNAVRFAANTPTPAASCALSWRDAWV